MNCKTCGGDGYVVNQDHQLEIYQAICNVLNVINKVIEERTHNEDENEDEPTPAEMDTIYKISDLKLKHAPFICCKECNKRSLDESRLEDSSTLLSAEILLAENLCGCPW